MGIKETMAFIHHTSWMGSKLGLARMNELLHRLGDPQNRLKFVHVAGTNGKGSACAMLASVLKSAGYRTGLYTSPHLVRVNERFNIGGTDISDEALCELADLVKPTVDSMADKPTEFELLTAMALLYFARERCDIVVLEVGLGGRLDATNVIPCPEVAVIMNIGLEHTEILGDTVEQIALEKAGIIKEQGTVVSYNRDDSVAAVFRTVCKEKNARLYETDFTAITHSTETLEVQTFDFGPYQGLRLPLLGPHQVRNAAVALTVIDRLREQSWHIPEDAIRTGLAHTKWPARMELLSKNPLFLLDGAHNPQCVDVLVDGLCRLLPNTKYVFLLGVLADKDYPAMLQKILPFAEQAICLTPDSPRALPAENLAAYLRDMGVAAIAYHDVSKGVIAALDAAGDAPIVAFGSLYLAGLVRDRFPSARQAWQRKTGIRARNRIPAPLRKEWSRRIVERIATSEAFLRAQTVLSYRAIRCEVDLSALDEYARQLNKRMVYPRCIAGPAMMALCPVSDAAWESGPYGIREPIVQQSERIDPADIDLVLCPCAAFDEKGHRIGMGGGYYDRYLPLCKNAFIAAVAFEAQKVAAIQPTKWDCIMDGVVTEVKIYS